MSLLQHQPRTKIIATLGDPAAIVPKEGKEGKPFGTYGKGCYDLQRNLMDPLDLDKLVETFVLSGVDIIRINLAHTKTVKEVTDRFLAVKKAILKVEEAHRGQIGEGRLGLLADLPGPKIRFRDAFLLPRKRLYVHFADTDEPRSGSWANSEGPLADEASALIQLGTTPFAEAAPKATREILASIQTKLDQNRNHVTDSVDPLLAFIGDSVCTLEVERVERGVVVCQVIDDQSKGQPLNEHQGFTVRGILKPISAFTQEDMEKLSALLEADYKTYPQEERVLSHVGISFCQEREDVRRVLSHVTKFLESRFPMKDLGDLLSEAPQLVAKIETEEGANNVDKILDFADGVMIARGDLALEMETVDLPEVAKNLVAKCNLRGKFVIMATQMLESMKRSIECTRPEAVDVFNAVVDGVDALMLSGETSSGSYPVHVIKKMQELASRAEAFVVKQDSSDVQIEGYFEKLVQIRDRVAHWQHRWTEIAAEYSKWAQTGKSTSEVARFVHNIALVKGKRLHTQESTDRVSHAACTMAAEAHESDSVGDTPDQGVAAIVSPTTSGRTARMLSRFRPQVPIIALPHSRLTARKLSINWGVTVSGIIRIVQGMNVGKLMEVSQSKLGNFSDQTVIFTCGTPLGKVGTTNLIFRGRVGDPWV